MDGIAPFIERVKKDGLIDQFFFIRYWEQGPHIRLRLKSKDLESGQELKRLIQTHFGTYFNKNPSSRDEPDWLKELPENKKWYENNSIQYIPYMPEVERYGGLEAMGIAENQFQFSSNAILKILSINHKKWDYNKALGTAIQLHLGLAYGVKMSLEEAIGFFGRFFNNWLPRAYVKYGEHLEKGELKLRRKKTLDLFQKNYQNHKQSLVPFFEQVWFALDEGKEFEQTWLNEWVINMTTIKKDLTSIHSKGKLIKPDWYDTDQKLMEWIEHQTFWSIYESYCHMINNRLGILNRDEGYLAYLIKESFISLHKSHA